VVTPAGRRRLAAELQARYRVSERHACRVIPINRKAVRYKPLRPSRDSALAAKLKSLGERYPRYGYLLLHEMLKAEGLVVNKKRTYRLYTEFGMQVRTRRRRKFVRPRVPMPLPTRPNERWSMDIVHDQLADGRRFKVLNIVDDYSRLCVGQLVDTSISGARIAEYLERVRKDCDLPVSLVLDNGPEMTSKAMFFFSRQRQVKLLFLQPGKPNHNAIVESFNGRFRVGCLNQQWFKDLNDARSIINAWRRHYNEERPHSSLGYNPPLVFEQHAA
jgi:putative transposase